MAAQKRLAEAGVVFLGSWFSPSFPSQQQPQEPWEQPECGGVPGRVTGGSSGAGALPVLGARGALTPRPHARRSPASAGGCGAGRVSRSDRACTGRACGSISLGTNCGEIYCPGRLGQTATAAFCVSHQPPLTHCQTLLPRNTDLPPPSQFLIKGPGNVEGLYRSPSFTETHNEFFKVKFASKVKT